MKVLIVPRDGLGDLVLSLPLANALKKHRPGWEVFYLVNRKQASMTWGHPLVDEEVLMEPGLAVYEKARFLRSFHFDIVIDLYPSPESALTLALAGIPQRVGTMYRWFSFLYTYRAKVRKHPSIKHEAEYNLEYLTPLGIRAELERPSLYLREEEKRWARQLLEGIPGPVIAINPSSGGTSRNWPFEKYRDLTRKLKERGFGIVITGDRGPEMDVEGILDLRGKTSIRELMAVLEASSILVSSSTGPMHIACALDTPTVSLFYPEGVAGPTRWGPLHPLSIVLTSEPGDQHLESISIDEVIAAVEKILESSG